MLSRGPRPIRNLIPLLLCAPLVACSLNTSFDDAKYRPIGQIDPVNRQQVPEPATAKPSLDESPTRYTADGYNDNALTSVRYGHPDTISMIMQTAKIHCAMKTIARGQGPNPQDTTLCHYQFPRFCGGHSFTLIEGPSLVALVFHDHDNHRNIIDQISDRHYARPGLWDLSDKLSVTSAFPEQQLSMQYQEAEGREWQVDMNSDDRKTYGTAYAKAVNEVRACF